MSVEVSALQIQPSWPPSVQLKLYYSALLAQPPWPLKLYYFTTHRVMLGRIFITVLCVERGLPLGTN